MPQSLLSEREGLPGEELVLGPRYSRTSGLLRHLESHQKPMALAPKKAQVGPTDHPPVPEQRPPGASPKRFSLSPPLPSGPFPNPLDPLGNSWWAIGRAIGYCPSPKGSLRFRPRRSRAIAKLMRVPPDPLLRSRKSSNRRRPSWASRKKDL